MTATVDTVRGVQTPHKITAKMFFEDQSVDVGRFIQVFHRWIRERALDDVVIDVANYAHLHHGLAVGLIAHGGMYGVDCRAGRVGLQYAGNTLSDNLDDALVRVMSRLTVAAELVEEAVEFDPQLSFVPHALEFRFIDQLRTPNSEDALSLVRAPLTGLLEGQFGAGIGLSRVVHSRQLIVTVGHGADGADSPEHHGA